MVRRYEDEDDAAHRAKACRILRDAISSTDVWQAQMDKVTERNVGTIAPMLKVRRPAT